MDGLYLCPNCRDRYTQLVGSLCHVCREQEMIDIAEPPPPIDWSVWDMGATMTEYHETDLKQLVDLATESSGELGSLGGGQLIDYETGNRYTFDEETAKFVASARSIVLELARRIQVQEEEDTQLRAEAAEAEVRQILAALKTHCKDDFVFVSDGGIDWPHTIAEFVSFIEFDARGLRA